MHEATEDSLERGAAAILVAALLVGLMGVAALALDGSNAYRTRSDAQRAADAGALTAAWEDCTGTSDPVAAGLTAAASNGYSGGVTVTASGTDWVVTVDESVDAPFSAPLGRTSLDVQARAVARCELTPQDEYAVFAGGTHCNNAMSISGSSSTITGNVHSNSDIAITGSSNTVHGSGSSVGTASGPPKVDWVPSSGNPSTEPSPLSYPLTYDIADFRPGGSKAVDAGTDYHDFGAWDITLMTLTGAGLFDPMTGTIASGLYYTTGDVSFNGGGVNGTVTFVTDPTLGTNDGKISLTGSGHSFQPYDSSGLMMFSNHQKQIPLSRNANCNSDAVSATGSSLNWSGIIYAPGGRVRMSAASNSTVNGSIVALTTDLSGASITLTYDSSLGESTPRVGLRE